MSAVLGLTFDLHGVDLSAEFAEWLSDGEVTLMDFLFTVSETGFAQALVEVEERRAKVLADNLPLDPLPYRWPTHSNAPFRAPRPDWHDSVHGFVKFHPRKGYNQNRDAYPA